MRGSIHVRFVTRSIGYADSPTSFHSLFLCRPLGIATVGNIDYRAISIIDIAVDLTLTLVLRNSYMRTLMFPSPRNTSNVRYLSSGLVICRVLSHAGASRLLRLHGVSAFRRFRSCSSSRRRSSFTVYRLTSFQASLTLGLPAAFHSSPLFLALRLRSKFH